MQEERMDLSEKDLEQIIAEAEGQMLAAPDYLEQMILRNVKKYEVRESVEIVPICRAIREKKPLIQAQPSKFGQLFAYSLKIAAASVAAIALVVMIPFMEEHMESSVQKREGIAMSREVSGKKDLEQADRLNLNEKTSDFCIRLFEKTNELLFRREEKR